MKPWAIRTTNLTSAPKGTEEQVPAETRRPLLLTRNFGLIWLSQLVSQVGDGVSNLALLWFVYSITGSPVKTTIIGLIHTIPPIVLGPFIGVFVDRLPKKFFLVGANVFRAVLMGLIPCAVSTDSFTVNLLYVLVLLDAMAMAMFSPALSSSVPLIVPRTQFTAANALIQSTTSLGIIFGPAVSGIGIALFGSQEVLCLNAVTYFVAALCLGLVRLGPTQPGAGETHTTGGSAWQDFVEGLAFVVAKQRIILLLILTAGCYGFGASALSTLFPVFARKLLSLGPVEVGYLWSSLGIGLLLMSVVLLWCTEQKSRRPSQYHLLGECGEWAGDRRAHLDQRPLHCQLSHDHDRRWDGSLYSHRVGGCARVDASLDGGARPRPLWHRCDDGCHQWNQHVRPGHRAVW